MLIASWAFNLLRFRLIAFCCRVSFNPAYSPNQHGNFVQTLLAFGFRFKQPTFNDGIVPNLVSTLVIFADLLLFFYRLTDVLY